jgi:hypothetical protein
MGNSSLTWECYYRLMTNTTTLKFPLNKEGFTSIENIYTHKEVNQIIFFIENANSTKPAFRKSSKLLYKAVNDAKFF